MADNNEKKYITVRLKFSRKGPVKYLGHLDMLRYFQKVMMRANINIRYSEGYNPHQIMSFAYPLGVSMETEGDYMDIDLISLESTDKLIEDLNQVMNEGVRIESAKVMDEKAKTAMAAVYAADYNIHISSHKEFDLATSIEKLMSQNEILITKEKCGKNKKAKGEVVTKDIKEGIFEIKPVNSDTIYMKLKSGSELNIKPVSVIEALSDSNNTDFKIEGITRINIFELDDKERIVPLID